MTLLLPVADCYLRLFEHDDITLWFSKWLCKESSCSLSFFFPHDNLAEHVNTLFQLVNIIIIITLEKTKLVISFFILTSTRFQVTFYTKSCPLFFPIMDKNSNSYFATFCYFHLKKDPNIFKLKQNVLICFCLGKTMLQVLKLSCMDLTINY